MPRLSNYRPEKGNDYKFIDRIISEKFQIGGTDAYIHKYLGPKNPAPGESSATNPTYDVIKETNIQDLLLIENRDRKYDTSIYKVRGVYNVQDIDFNLSQFGLFIDQDTIFMTVHINDFIKNVGRKPLSGDVIELPHLRDEFALSDSDYAMPRFFVISDVGRAAEGFSVTWYPHLYRLKLTKVNNQQQFADILNVPADPDANFVGDYDPATTYNPGEIVRYQGTLYTVTAPTTGNAPPNASFFTTYGGQSIQEVTSSTKRDLEINDMLIAQAEADAAMSGHETRQFYTLHIDENGKSAILPSANPNPNAVTESPAKSGYSGYLLGDGFPDNGIDFGHGIAFPNSATLGDFFLRTDFLPNRLFRYNGVSWLKYEDAVRHTLTNTDTRQTLKTSFINNPKTSIYNGEELVEKQFPSKALRPRADL